MNQKQLEQQIIDYTNQSTHNFLSQEIALSEDLINKRLFDEPIFGYASAMNPFFEALKRPDAIGEHFLLPRHWLSNAQTVVSIFFPFSDVIRHRKDPEGSLISDAWLHGRIEGQKFIFSLCNYIKNKIEEEDHHCLIPVLSKEFSSKSPSTDDKSEQNYYTSNWSERHIAYICGLGTFGLSGGLITKRGISGRIGSFITDLRFEESPRVYSELYEYCTMCGACIKNCPTGAISLERGKDHPLCSAFLDKTKVTYAPRYGCGKCQLKVSCETKIPKKKFSSK